MWLTGGQMGHEGTTLKKVAVPDKVITHRPQQTCDACQYSLADIEICEVETRQYLICRHYVTN